MNLLFWCVTLVSGCGSPSCQDGFDRGSDGNCYPAETTAECATYSASQYGAEFPQILCDYYDRCFGVTNAGYTDMDDCIEYESSWANEWASTYCDWPDVAEDLCACAHEVETLACGDDDPSDWCEDLCDY